MAVPLVAGIPALLAKLGIGKAAATGAAAGATKMAGGAGFRGLLGNALKAGFAPDPTKSVLGQVAGRVAPDVLFGGLAAMQTPGDFTDKLIAGTTQAVGGGLGGGLTTGLTGGKLGMLGEFAGGYGGDVAGMMIGDNLQRGKDKIMGGKGQTAYERMSEEQQQQFADQIRNETMMKMGIGPGYLPGIQDQYFV